MKAKDMSFVKVVTGSGIEVRQVLPDRFHGSTARPAFGDGEADRPSLTRTWALSADRRQAFMARPGRGYTEMPMAAAPVGLRQAATT